MSLNTNKWSSYLRRYIFSHSSKRQIPNNIHITKIHSVRQSKLVLSTSWFLFFFKWPLSRILYSVSYLKKLFFVCSFWRPPMYWEPQWRLAALTDCFRAVVVVAVVATSNNAVTSSSLLLAKRSTRRACLLKRPSLFLHCYDLLLLCYFYYHQHSFLVYRPFFMNDTI